VAVTSEPVERTVLLARASHIVVRFQGDEEALRHAPRFVGISAVALSGDPGWRARTAAGDLPWIGASCNTTRGDEPRARLKARPGRYRIRIGVSDDGKLHAEPSSPSEVDVEVPQGGEAEVVLELPRG